MIWFLRVFFLLLWLVMTVVVIRTSLESNLFEVGPSLLEIPWMVATLWDFYINIAIIAIWMWAREKRWLVRSVWLLCFVVLGSIATVAYLLVQLFRVPASASIRDVIWSQGE